MQHNTASSGFPFFPTRSPMSRRSFVGLGLAAGWAALRPGRAWADCSNYPDSLTFNNALCKNTLRILGEDDIGTLFTGNLKNNVLRFVGRETNTARQNCLIELWKVLPEPGTGVTNDTLQYLLEEDRSDWPLNVEQKSDDCKCHYMFPWTHVPDRTSDSSVYKVKNDIKVLFNPVSQRGFGFLERFGRRTMKELFCTSKVRYSEEDLLGVELASRLGIFRQYPYNLCANPPALGEDPKPSNGYCCDGTSPCRSTTDALYCEASEGGCSLMSDPCP